MKTKNIMIVLAGIIVLAVIAFSVTGILSSKTNTETTNSQQITGEYQSVKLSLDENYDYKLEPSVLKKGVPVRMEVDMKSVVGCARSITIPEFGVKKYVTQNDNIIIFTPTKSGSFKIACSMNMYVGTFSVSDDGQANVAIQTQSATSQNIPIQEAAQQNVQKSSGGCGCMGGSGTCGMV